MNYYKIDTSKKLSEKIIDYLRDEGIATRMLEKRAESLWQTIMGPTVCRATKSVSVSKGVMRVCLTSSVVREQLFNMRAKMIAEFNKAVGHETIKEIKLS